MIARTGGDKTDYTGSAMVSFEATVDVFSHTMPPRIMVNTKHAMGKNVLKDRKL